MTIISAAVSVTSEGDALAPVGIQTTGVLQTARIAGIVQEPRRVLKITRAVRSRRPRKTGRKK